MTIYASPFMIFVAITWAAGARREHATAAAYKWLWGTAELVGGLACLLTLMGRTKWVASY